MRLLTLVLLLTRISPSLAQFADCEILNYETRIEHTGKKVIEHTRFELQINNGAGTEYAEVSIPFSESCPIEGLEAAIYDLSGKQIRKLKKKDVVTRTPWSNVNFHSDSRLYTFKLIHTSYPYILKYKYTCTSNHYISIARWTPITFKKLNTRKASLTVEVPNDEKVRVLEQNIDKAQISEIDDKKVYRWEVQDFRTKNEEYFSPHLYEINPFVIVSPENFKYGVAGQSDTWKDLGNWECGLIEGLDQLSEEEKKKVHELTDGITSNLEKTKTLYHYLQDNTRYINVSFKIGGHLPHPANYVCENRYGDCKALSNYMKAMLKEVGIPSNYTTIYAGIKPWRVNKDYPNQFANHVVLTVPFESDTIWLECTSKTAPFNYMGAWTQNRWALFNKKDESKLIITPKHSLSQALESYTTTVNISDEVSFSSKGTLRGRKYDDFKGFDTQLSEKEKKEYIDDIGFSHKADIQKFEISRPHRDSAYLHIKLTGSASKITGKLGSKLLLSPFRDLDYSLTPVEERKSDIFVYYPVHKCDTIIYSFDKNISQIKGLSTEDIVSEFGRYTRKYKTRDHKLIITRTFQLKQNEYDFGKYEDFYSFVSKACRLDQQKTIITF